MQGGATVSEGRTYNAYGETKTSLTKHKTPAGIETTLLSFDYEPTDSGTTYPRDGLGRIKRKTETELVSGTSVTTKYRYEYDLAGRLTDVYEDGVLVEHYGYGVNGTRTSVTKGGTTTSATYDDQDRLLTFGGTTYGWTAAGRLASKAVGGTTTNTYAYDSQGNLLTVTDTPAGTINYVIDPLGRRVGRTAGGTTRRWFYSGSLRIVGELDPAGATLTQYVYGTRVNVPEYAIRGTQVYRLVTDHLGSLRLVVRVSDQTIVQRMEYDAFGVVGTDYIAPGWDALPFGFAGGLYDRDTKLVRFGARDYESETGRWTAKDPLGFGGGDSNLFAYAANDPTNLLDPSGMAFDPSAVESDFVAADGYLSAVPEWRNMVDYLERSPGSFTVLPTSGASYFEPATNTIFWNSASGLNVGKWKFQSAALGLLHEVAHAYDQAKNPKTCGKRQMSYDDRMAACEYIPAWKLPYGSDTDFWVITGPETRAAYALGEPVRSGHYGVPFGVPSVSYHKK